MHKMNHGAPAPRNDAQPGHQEPQTPQTPAAVEPIQVRRLRRIREGQPSAWQGETREGHPIHISYRFGEITVELGIPPGDNGQEGIQPKPQSRRAFPSGSLRWIRLAQFNVHKIKAFLDEASTQDLETRLLQAERVQLAEIRAARGETPKPKVRKSETGWELVPIRQPRPMVIGEEDLLRWFDLRNRHLSTLNKYAGGNVPIEVGFIWSSR